VTGIPTARYVDHAGYTVRDLDEAVCFFVDVLGAALLYATEPCYEPGTDYMLSRFGVSSDTSVRLAVLRFGATHNLELVEFTGPGQRTDYPPVSDAGGCHLAIHVDDFAAAEAYLRARPELRIRQPHDNGPPGQGEEGGLLSVYFETPFGMRLEIIKRPERQRYEAETDARAFRTAERWPTPVRPRDPDDTRATSSAL
jgi:catechol 2,3-dioxygenase-like lactoylglutathione lyase family enzyme